MSQSVYKVRKITDTVYSDGWRDGVRGVFYSVDKLIHLTGGWNSLMNPVMVSYHYTLNPRTFEKKKLPNAPWSPRHTHGFGEASIKLWVWGWSSYPIDGAMDVWSWSYSEGWIKHFDNWQYPPLTHSNYCTYKNRYLYVSGGFNSIQYYNSVWRLDTQNVKAGWEKICDLPQFLHKAASGNIIEFKGDLVQIGGGEFVNFNTQPLIPNTKIGISKDEGRTWQEAGDSPLLNSGVWGNAESNDEALFFISGSDKDGGSSMINNNRLIMTCDLKNFEYLDKRLVYRHATATARDDEQSVHLIMGNGRNDWHVIKRIADTKQFFIS